jgi:uncharacterized membrane protein YdjX (TVP38/TMEM64 family)
MTSPLLDGARPRRRAASLPAIHLPACSAVTEDEPAVILDRRLASLAALLVLATTIVLIGPLHRWLLGLFVTAEVLMRHHPSIGMLAFVGLAALSAMLAFLSSTVLLPAAIQVWGPAMAAGLLWAGWLLGGLAAYGVGRYLGRPVAEILIAQRTLTRYEGWVRAQASFRRALLIQLALPSDAAGYVFGITRYPLRWFTPGLALAEIPYALGAVYLGVSFLERRLVPLLAVGLIGALLGWLALRAILVRAAPGSPRPATTDHR